MEFYFDFLINPLVVERAGEKNLGLLSEQTHGVAAATGVHSSPTCTPLEPSPSPHRLPWTVSTPVVHMKQEAAPTALGTPPNRPSLTVNTDAPVPSTSSNGPPLTVNSIGGLKVEGSLAPDEREGRSAATLLSPSPRLPGASSDRMHSSPANPTGEVLIQLTQAQRLPVPRPPSRSSTRQKVHRSSSSACAPCGTSSPNLLPPPPPPSPADLPTPLAAPRSSKRPSPSAPSPLRLLSNDRRSRSASSPGTCTTASRTRVEI